AITTQCQTERGGCRTLGLIPKPGLYAIGMAAECQRQRPDDGTWRSRFGIGQIRDEHAINKGQPESGLLLTQGSHLLAQAWRNHSLVTQLQGCALDEGQ